MISIVCWKWGEKYTADQVNVLARAIGRFYEEPHEFVCVTSEPEGLDAAIRIVAPPVLPHHEQLGSPHGDRFPACYRRLWNFSREAGEAFGPRFFAIDIDTVITGDLRPIFNRSEEFMIWGDPGHTWAKYGGGAYLMKAGCRDFVWTMFRPGSSPALALAEGYNGSDQAWISYCLYPREATYTREHGMYTSAKWAKLPRGPEAQLPVEVRMVHFSGKLKPWSFRAQKRYPWINEYYR